MAATLARTSVSIAAGGHGAYATDAKDTPGYYVVDWSSSPYTLQRDTPSEPGSTILIPSGELEPSATR